MKRKDHPKVVSFGAGGFTVYFESVPLGPNSSQKSKLSGYDSPDSFFRGERGECPADYEGVPFVDMREAVKGAEGFRHALSGPMLDVDLPPGAVDKFTMPEGWLATCICEVSSQFGAMLALHLVSKRESAPGALDYVSLPEWCALWKKAGARVGVIRSGQFVELN